MKKIIFILIFTLSSHTYADDYKTAQRINAGDVVSADVLNDILDRIEITLKSVTASDFVGTWDVTQSTCVGGYLGNCSGSVSPAAQGFGADIDGLYRQRIDTVTFSDDGDGTYSLLTTNYCAFVRSGHGNTSCNLNFAIVDRNFVFNNNGHAAYAIQRISNTRIVLSLMSTASGSYNIIRLDKKALPPSAPTSLAATVSSGSIALTWIAGDANEDSYDVQRKSSALGEYISIGLPTTESYSDTTGFPGSTYWYRIFAKNTNGTSIGSNVISVVAQ